jgi:DNA-binding transcriptional ArsR family regulator
MSPEMLESVAARFKVLAEPARLHVLQALQRGPQHVSALMALTGLNQANLSRHLQLLHTHGFVSRRRQGTFIHYAIADARVFALCDLMCEAVKRPTVVRHRGATA